MLSWFGNEIGDFSFAVRALVRKSVQRNRRNWAFHFYSEVELGKFACNLVTNCCSLVIYSDINRSCLGRTIENGGEWASRRQYNSVCRTNWCVWKGRSTVIFGIRTVTGLLLISSWRTEKGWGWANATCGFLIKSSFVYSPNLLALWFRSCRWYYDK